MEIRKYKILFGLCQCKGCFKKATHYVLITDGAKIELCEEHLTEILLDPYWRT